MNLLNIIDEINIADPEFQDRISPRRAAIKNITSFGSKVALAAVPMVFSTLFKKAYGQTAAPQVNDVLNYALKLEYLEAAFYNAGVASSLGFTASEKAYLVTIQGHENAHVNFLKSILTTNAVAQTSQGQNGNYDFTGGFNTTTNTVTGAGPFANVLTNVDTYFAVAQAFEDTGVRAYKGQAGFLLGNQVVLTAALNIHSVEARHASAIRQIRRSRGAATLKPWITGANDSGVPQVANNYAGEDNVVQGPVTITNLPSVNGNISVAAATESFDEPLTSAQVVDLVKIFGVR